MPTPARKNTPKPARKPAGRKKTGRKTGRKTGQKPRRGSVLAPVAPQCMRKHPRLTHNRHVNEHLSFCALHAKGASDATLSKQERADHKEAARLHMTQALRHYRTLK